MFVATLIVPPYVFGRIVRRLADQKRAARGPAGAGPREAVRAERDRIARELHDVIAHSVSAMVVQTAAAQDLVRTDPDRAEAVLADVADTGRRALAETGRLLHVIRDDADELGPRPGTRASPTCPRWWSGSGPAGSTVDLDVREPLPPLPAGVDVSAYRIVQEALTNALRYAADRTGRADVSRRPRTACRSRLDQPRPTRADAVARAAGSGLLGMAERVAAARRHAHARRHGDGRFELAATLPVGPA